MSHFLGKSFSAKYYIGLVFGLLSAVTVNASIISTNVQAGVEIRADQIVEATATNSGTTSASVDITSDVSGASVHSTLGFSSLSSDAATFNFDIGLNGGNYTGSDGYSGQSDWGSNAGFINYFAISNLNLSVSWSFDYTGSSPFGLNIINLSGVGGPSLDLGNVGSAGHHEGSTTYALLAGNSYLINVNFYPNVHGSIGPIDGTLSGALDFKFGKTDVPESSGIVLFGLGLIGLGLARRRKIA